MNSTLGVQILLQSGEKK